MINVVFQNNNLANDLLSSEVVATKIMPYGFSSHHMEITTFLSELLLVAFRHIG